MRYSRRSSHRCSCAWRCPRSSPSPRSAVRGVPSWRSSSPPASRPRRPSSRESRATRSRCCRYSRCRHSRYLLLRLATLTVLTSMLTMPTTPSRASARRTSPSQPRLKRTSSPRCCTPRSMLPTPTARPANPLVMTPTRRCRRAYRCASTWSRCYARAARYVENSRPGASANSPSSFDTPRQRQTKLRATSSLGQPRPVGRYALIGRPYGDRPCFPHMQATRTCTARAATQCSPCVAATLRSSCGSSASAPPLACCSSAICSQPSNTWPQSETQCRASFARASDIGAGSRHSTVL